MDHRPLDTFGRTAQGLARTPLGIIALFIVLVYGLAALVTGFSASMSPAEKLPLIWFLVRFPLAVLGVFAWLVAKHGGKLYAPGDFQNEEHYVRLHMAAAASLTAAYAHECGAIGLAPGRSTCYHGPAGSPLAARPGLRRHAPHITPRPPGAVNVCPLT